jgi:hypothetical protein
MTISEARDIIFAEARSQGEPLTLDVALAIAKKLFPPDTTTRKNPGDIAKFHRERYEGVEHGIPVDKGTERDTDTDF